MVENLFDGGLRLAVGRVDLAGTCATPPAAPIGTAKPIPAKLSLLGGIRETFHDPDHLTFRIEQRTSRVAGVHCCVELDESSQSPTMQDRKVRSKPEITPAESDPTRPIGLPTA